MNANTTVTVRDYSTLDGGGYAVTHLATCGKLLKRPTAPGLFVQDTQYAKATIESAERGFRKLFTVEVDVRRCECATRHLDAVTAETARLDAIDKAEAEAENQAEALAWMKYVGR